MEAPMDNSNAATEAVAEDMSKLQISHAPVLDDLMKWHLYIGYSQADREMAKELLAFMRNNKLKCSVRSSLDVNELAQADNIKQGIVFSHKCLLYISPDYLKDPNSQEELKEAERKFKLLGSNSVFCIVQSNVNPTQFERYNQFQLIPLSVSENVPDCSRAVQNCLDNYHSKDAILKDYELKMDLQLGPKENIGVGVAYTYFFGFLQIVVPGFWEKFQETMANNGINDDNLVKKMLIVIRKSINSPPRLNEPGVEQTKNLCIKQVFARAGKDRREYTLYVYKLAANDKYKNDFYFIADFPACLFALREAFDYELNTTMMKNDDVFEARNEFVLTVKALLSHQDNQAKFGNQWELLLWHDEDNRVELSEFLHQQIESKHLTELSRDITLLPVNPVDDRETFKVGRGVRDYAMYAEGEHYDLKDSDRGYCVIISNYYFLDQRLDRDGGQAEIDKLEELFKALKFEVVTERNLQGQEMFSILKEYRDKDHSNKDAFVCCLLSHGSKGRILGTGFTDDSISVVELMELFYEENCPGLKGKPKLFFIGTCQVGDSVAKDEEPGTNLQSTSATPISSSAGIGDSSNTVGLPQNFSSQLMKDMIPPTVDFIVSYACLPYSKANRHPKEGGFYVQALCKYLKQDLEIDVALRRVNQEVRKRWNEIGAKQDPFHIIMPPQRFLFLKHL